MARPQPHPVDPSRGSKDESINAYRAGYVAGRASNRGGCCLLSLALIPVYLAAALWQRTGRSGEPSPAGRPKRTVMTAPAPTRLTTAEYVAKLVAAAPPPNAEQILTLRGLLGPRLAQLRCPTPGGSR